jgi:hypothetical protein
MRRADAARAAALVAFLLGAASARADGTRAGEALYREGRAPGGAPLEALVQGAVPVTGAQLSCAACHGRSGLGQVEGRIVPPPIARPFLAAPRTGAHARPAYDERTLARAIRDGVDAAGRPLDPLMPRYRISDADLVSLLAYLRVLGAQPSPGASDDALHFATVVTPDAPAGARDATLRVLRSWFAAKTAGQRDLRARHGPRWPESFGDWVLHEWILSGPPSGWAAQLEARYRARPVFAIVSGVGREWGPVHAFCEARALPCLLPNVETPPEPVAGGYALYFSRGAVLEAQAIAAALLRDGARSAVQVFRAGEEGARAAAAFRRAAAGLAVRDVALRRGERARLPAGEGADAVVLWLGPADVSAAGAAPAGARIFLSATLLGGEPEALAGALPSGAIVARPWAAPSDAAARWVRVASWSADRGLPAVPAELRRVVDQTFFALFLLSEGVGHLRRNFQRDYLIEAIDHMTGVEAWSSYWPQASFGPGQRVLSKGCWLVPLGGGAPERVVP